MAGEGGSGAARRLGQAPKTKQGLDVAMRIIIWYRKTQGLPEEVQPEEIAGENLENYMSRICVLFAGTPVPFKADVNLEPTTENKKRKVNPDCVLQYIGRHLTAIRHGVGKNHPDLKDLREKEFPKWWTAMRAQFKEESNRWMINSGGNYEFGCSEVKPLYSDLKGRGVDIVSIQKKLLREARGNNNNIRNMCLINMSHAAFARGGEGKFQELHEWYWDEFLGVVNTPWREIKTLDFYGMARVFNSESWGLDFYCTFGMYTMCGNGLWRTEGEVAKGLMNKAFPHLHTVGNERVSGIVNEALRSGLPECWTPNEKKKISTKSLRGGAITEAANHPQTDFFSITAASGHSTQSNLDSYLDRKNPLRTIPAVSALQGERDIFAKVVVPSLDALYAGLAVTDIGVVTSGVRRLLNCMFTINVPDYQEGGKNRVIVEISAASMLFHHPEINRIQGNIVSSALLNAARSANIQDPRYRHETPAGIIEIYSKLIRADFSRRKQESRVQSIASSGGSSAAQWSMVADILDGVNGIKSTLGDVVQEAASQRATIAMLEGQMHSLSASRKELKSKLSSMLKENASLKNDLHQSLNALHRYNPSIYQTPQRLHNGGSLLSSPFVPEPSVVDRQPCPAREERGDVPESAAVVRAGGVATAAAGQARGVGTPRAGGLIVPQQDDPVHEEERSDAVLHCLHDTDPRPAPHLSYADLQYTHAAHDTSTKTGNQGERMYNVLIEMSTQSQFLDEDELASFNCPTNWKRNKQLLQNCLEMIDVSIEMLPDDDAAPGQSNLIMNRAGGRAAVKILVDGLTEDVDLAQIKEAAFHLEEILYKALFIVEEVPEEEWKKKTKRLKRNVTGLGGRVKKYRDLIHSKSKNPGKPCNTKLIPKAEYDKLEKASRRPSESKRKHSTGGSSDGPTKKPKKTLLSSKPASSKSKQGFSQPAKENPVKEKPRLAKPTLAKPASSRSAASVKPASQSLSQKAPANTATIKNEFANAPSKVASKNEVIEVIDLCDSSEDEDEYSEDEDDSSEDEGDDDNFACAWEDVAKSDQKGITLRWKEFISNSQGFVSESKGKDLSGKFRDFGRSVDVKKFITKHSSHAEKLALWDDEREHIVGTVLSQSITIGSSKIEPGDQYLIGYFDDDDNKKVMALSKKQTQKYLI